MWSALNGSYLPMDHLKWTGRKEYNCGSLTNEESTHMEEGHISITHTYLVMAEGWSQGDHVTSHAVWGGGGNINKRWNLYT